MSGFGEHLKHERETRQVSLREISDATKISLRYLEALEQNRFDVLPGGVFNRGFVRAYAEHIGIDCDATVDRYLREVEGLGLSPSEPPAPLPAPGAPNADPAAARSTPPGAFAASRPGTGRRPVISGIADADTPSRSPRPLVIALWSIVGSSLVLLVLLLFTAPWKSESAQPPGQGGPLLPTVEPAGPAVPARPDAEATVEDIPADAVDADVEGSRPAPAAEPTPPPVTRGSPPAVKPETRPAATPPASRPKPVPPRPEPQDPPGREAAATAVPQTAGTPPVPVGEEIPGAMSLRVETARRTWVWLQCDADVVLDGMMNPGEIAAYECLSRIRVSAPTDAAAVRLSINGAACLPLGDEGAQVYGYTIRIDDHKVICPPSGRGAGRRD